MADQIAALNERVNSIVWGPAMLALLVGIGVYYTFRLKFFQVTKIGLWMSGTFGQLFSRRKAGYGAVTPFQALTTALAATVGTGNMVGVATAIVAGGPGAIFWMWVSAFFGMMTKYAEILLSLQYRKRNARGEWVGGPMHYITGGMGRGFGWLAALFSLFGALAAFGIGNMTQVNAIASSLETALAELGLLSRIALPGEFSFFKFGVGVLLAILAGMAILGGMKRIGSISEKLVPFMSIVYIAGSIVALIVHRQQLGPALTSIFSQAFTLPSAAGGALGYTMAKAMRYGVARGVFSNEAGLGSAPIAHAAADTDSPVKQGLWGIFEVFMDTIVICTMTALVILSSGAFTGPGSLDGAPLTIAAYQRAFGPFGIIFVTVSICLFAFSTVLSWSLYGQRCFEFLTGGRGLGLYRLVFVLCIMVSAVIRLELAWDIADTLNGLMALPNMLALIALSVVVIRMSRSFLRKG